MKEEESQRNVKKEEKIEKEEDLETPAFIRKRLSEEKNFLA